MIGSIRRWNSGLVGMAIAGLLLLNPKGILAQDSTSGPWVMQSSGTKAGLRGIHAVGGGVAWASGTNGTVLRTEDSGYMWQSCAMPPNADKLDFRGIWAWDANTAIVMSSGSGDQSRLYKTTDGCSHWTLLYTNPDKDGFWDALVFSGREQGFILGDPVNRRFVLFFTLDEGITWGRVNSKDLDSGNIKIGAFAASNSALTLAYDALPMFGTGGPGGPWLYVPDSVCTSLTAQKDPAACFDGFLRFEKEKLPMAGASASAGVFSLALRDAQHGIAVGGDYTKPNDSTGTAAWTADGGKTWTAAEKPPHGYRSAVAWDADAKAWIAVGPNGSDVSYDDGKTWSPLDSGNWNALSLPWVAGPDGRIAKLGALPARK
jgi:photosystem II stability/assembly factor-like uncharacterized protein